MIPVIFGCRTYVLDPSIKKQALLVLSFICLLPMYSMKNPIKHKITPILSKKLSSENPDK